MRINVVRPRSDADWETLAAQWREVEARADGSFFQSWTWVGCRLRERFTDPFVIQAMDGAQMVGLALFNRTGLPLRRTLYLHETGRRGEDSVFIEHNGPLLARGRADLLRPMLAAALAHGRLVLSGVPDHVRSAAASLGRCRVRATRPAPFAPLAGLTEAGWLAGLGGLHPLPAAPLPPAL